MKPEAIAKVVEAMAEAQKPNETINVSIRANEYASDFVLAVTNASSAALDAITDNGYYLSSVYGSVVVTDKEA